MSRIEDIVRSKLNKIVSRIENPIEVLEYHIEQMMESEIELRASIDKSNKKSKELSEKAIEAEKKSVGLVEKAKNNFNNKNELELAYWKHKESEMLATQATKLEQCALDQLKTLGELQDKIKDMQSKQEILKTRIEIAKTTGDAEKFTINFSDENVEIEKLVLRATRKADMETGELEIDESDKNAWIADQIK